MRIRRNKPPRWFAPALIAGVTGACGLFALLFTTTVN